MEEIIDILVLIGCVIMVIFFGIAIAAFMKIAGDNEEEERQRDFENLLEQQAEKGLEERMRRKEKCEEKKP